MQPSAPVATVFKPQAQSQLNTLTKKERPVQRPAPPTKLFVICLAREPDSQSHVLCTLEQERQTVPAVQHHAPLRGGFRRGVIARQELVHICSQRISCGRHLEEKPFVAP